MTTTATIYRIQADYCRDRAEVCRIKGSPDVDRWEFEAGLFETWARLSENKPEND